MDMGGRFRAGRVVLGLVAVGALALVATGCRPEPAATPTVSASISTEGSAPSASATPIETDEADAGIGVPVSCEDIYSDAMIATLQAEIPPLNDPGVTMLSSENVEVLELLDSGVTTLRCSWGAPSERGLATNVTAVDEAQALAIAEALPAAGFGCEPYGDGTICRIEQRGVTLDDVEYARGETHYLGDGGLVTTAWLNVSPDGYTEDIVATLWG